MSNAIFETKLSDTLRVRAYVDETGYVANEVLGDTSDGSNGWFFMPKRGFYGALDYYISREHSDGKLSAEMLELAKQLSDFKSYDEIAEDLLKHATRAGYTAKKYELRGYMQGDYAEVIVYTLGDYGDGMAETLDAWFKGDIYTVTVERLEVFISPTSGRELEYWEVEESLGCVLLETGSDDELRQIANSCFTLETAAA